MMLTPLSSLSTKVYHSLPETTSLAAVDAGGGIEMRCNVCFKDEKTENVRWKQKELVFALVVGVET